MKRRLARELAVQSLYQMEINKVSGDEALETVLQEAKGENESGVQLDDEPALRQYAEKLINGVTTHAQPIDDVLSGYLQGWRMERLSRVDRQVMRIATFEMLYMEDVPPRVAINEAIEVAKHFGLEESGKFVNGVLGKFIKDLDEIKARIQV